MNPIPFVVLVAAFVLVEAQHCKHPLECTGIITCPNHEHVDCQHGQCVCSHNPPAPHPSAEAHHCKQPHECTGHITCVGTEHVECQQTHCVCVQHPQPCLVLDDCSAVSCHAHELTAHCLDSHCQCI